MSKTQSAGPSELSKAIDDLFFSRKRRIAMAWSRCRDEMLEDAVEQFREAASESFAEVVENNTLRLWVTHQRTSPQWGWAFLEGMWLTTRGYPVVVDHGRIASRLEKNYGAQLAHEYREMARVFEERWAKAEGDGGVR